MSEQNLRENEQAYDQTKVGEVQIADEVVTIIAGLAATEVEGVVSLAGNITNDKVGKRGIKNLAKGVKVDVLQDSVSVEVSMLLKYGYSIPGVTQKVQDKVKTAIENMTGLQVTDVNVRVVGVEIEKND